MTIFLSLLELLLFTDDDDFTRFKGLDDDIFRKIILSYYYITIFYEKKFTILKKY